MYISINIDISVIGELCVYSLFPLLGDLTNNTKNTVESLHTNESDIFPFQCYSSGRIMCMIEAEQINWKGWFINIFQTVYCVYMHAVFISTDIIGALVLMKTLAEWELWSDYCKSDIQIKQIRISQAIIQYYCST